MTTLHKPIMYQEILDIFSEKEGPKEKFLDATFGRGGHTKKILDTFPNIQVTALDRDPEAIEYGNKEFSEYIKQNRFEIKKSNFSQYRPQDNIVKHDNSDSASEYDTYDGILMDLGVSSPQLDTPSRGFSLYQEGPLDMRMDPTQGVSAREIVNEWEERELADLFFNYGDVRKSFRVAKAIVTKRQEKPFETTLELADVIAKSLGWRKPGHHPATECFQALRIVVNDELRAAEEGITNLSQMLNDKGRLFVITFHSTEDRLVKRLLLSLDHIGKPVFKKVIQPSKEEQRDNPRSRSAKLRVFEKGMEQKRK
jgi:16S rRNA (cytosine1402-N4)-methyltransferase